jgi:small nuclear ribonucleoprotein (snRNP)-like protein
MFLYAQEIVTVSLNKDKAYVGDVVEFVVEAQLPKNAQISAVQNFRLDDFEILKTNINRLPYDNNIYELKFEISAYKTGHLTIKPLTVFYINPDGTNNLFFTPEKSIEIQSLIADPKSADIKDIKSLKKLKIKGSFIVLIVVVFFFIVILAIYIGKDIKEERKKAKIIVLDVRTSSLNNLNDLYQNRTNLTTRDFYYKMSEILRTYISKQYKFDAMEMTTSEFFEKTKEFLPAQVNVNEFKNYLKIFNLARYADFMPNEKEIEDNYAFTKKLLELI